MKRSSAEERVLMRLVLALETSSMTYAVAVGAGDRPCVQRASHRDDPAFTGFGELVAETLAAAEATFGDVGTIAVDVGPGGLSTIRAAVALERKDPKRAVELLQATNSIELSQPTPLAVFLCPVYLRGEAYLMLRDGKAAAAEFQKFIDYRGLVGNFQWGALARLELGRAFALSGDVNKARVAYQDFLTIWKDADPDVPVVKEAKAEYEKLQ